MSDVAHAEEPKEEKPQSNEAETEARRLGWVDKEEFRGDPDKWRPAEEFLDRGKRILPIVLRDNEKLQRKIGSLESKIADFAKTSEEMVAYHRKAEERSYQRAKAEFDAKIEQAAQNADLPAVRAAMAERDALDKSRPEKAEEKKPVPQVDPKLMDWISDNPWFNADRLLNTFASEAYDQLFKSAPGMSVDDRLAETKRLTIEKFPEKFGINTNREAASKVSAPTGGSGGRKRSRGYDDLPDDARKACDNFVRTIPGYKREDYIKDYAWES